jgi:hypothetical protein
MRVRLHRCCCCCCRGCCCCCCCWAAPGRPSHSGATARVQTYRRCVCAASGHARWAGGGCHGGAPRCPPAANPPAPPSLLSPPHPRPIQEPPAVEPPPEEQQAEQQGQSPAQQVQPPATPGAGRSLRDYLSLPLEQYSLLDPSWIKRDESAPDLFQLVRGKAGGGLGVWWGERHVWDQADDASAPDLLQLVRGSC